MITQLIKNGEVVDTSAESNSSSSTSKKSGGSLDKDCLLYTSPSPRDRG